MFKVQQLKIYSQTQLLVDIQFEIQKSFALVGQSGSGKSLTLKAILGMLAHNLNCDLDIEADFTLQRGKTVSMVPQNPFTALSPLTKIKDQFVQEVDEVIQYLHYVELDKSLLFRYPSELSGGQLQRVIIAMALSSKPKLLLLDEPTTALDTRTKESVLKLIKALQTEIDYKILFVTHDIEATQLLCEESAILKDGKIIEKGSVSDLLAYPKTEYARRLISANFKNRERRS